MPATELEPDAAKDANGGEAQAFMKALARLVRYGDARIRVPEPLKDEDAKERLVQRASDAAAVDALVDVRRDLDRPLVGGAGSMWRPIRVADDASILLRH